MSALPVPRGRAPFCACGCGDRTSTVRTEYILRHRPPPDDIERLIRHIEIGGPCWTWVGHVAHNGYGISRFRGRRMMAHRAVWFALVGPIPDDLVIDHLCRNRVCVNPDHLEPVTQSVNLQRAIRPDYAARRKAALARPCPKGHERTSENVVIRTGKLVCIPCLRAAQRAHRLRKVAS